ncbi:hypothetical protein ACHAWO_013786 [Cyclotella atomus]|jgi:RNA recognition motif-containing protein|uniref:Uncharacterized protein n=1 Tax=Cyclotella atomus TaxID=382360 RepID=A0ABD3PGT9_9STRA
MASDSSSSTSSSSSSSRSSSSSDHSSTKAHNKAHPPDVTAAADIAQHELLSASPDDESKAFLSRIPQSFNEDSIRRILHEKFGSDCIVDVSLVSVKEEETNKDGSGKDEKKEHRGFGFVTFSSKSTCKMAIECGTVRGSAKENSKRKHTLYIQQVVRDEHDSESNAVGKDVCFLWKKYRCPYGDECKFFHEGPGGCANDAVEKQKVQKCFSFKKRGKCKLGDECPYSHDVGGGKNENVDLTSAAGEETKKPSNDKSAKDCINWKTKGKCRKGDKCPYGHDESLRLKAVAKKGKSKDASDNLSKTKRKLQERADKVKQSLSIRVFGLNYSTTREDVHEFFAHCGKIVEITFPTYEDSGRSKGYCGILFTSPKAVRKAVEEMDGSELHGRWLSVQEGKMYLRKWEEDERARRGGNTGEVESGDGMTKEAPLIGEYGQKVKKRKKHGFAE